MTIEQDSLTAPRPKDWILGIAPYVPGKASSDDGRRLVKLSANENPLGTSPAAHAAAQAALADLATYPDPAAHALREAIAGVHGLDPARIVCGTGSGELLHIAASAYAGPGDEVIYVNYGFSLYDIVARRVGAVPVVAADRDYGTDIDAILAAVTERTRIVFLANPNNPTGTFTPRAGIARLVDGLPPRVLLVLDQAYAEYLDESEDDHGLDLARSRPNVLVTRTLSKIYGLAAERIGWGYGDASVIDALNRIRGAFNLSASAQAAGVAALRDQDFVARSRAHNREWRGWFAREIEALGNHGVRAVPSGANFLLVLFEGATSAETVYKALMEAGYATRWLPGQGLPHGLRITIGSEAHMRDIAARIRALVSGGAA
ncbi:MAG: histidinol-phosphate transaminase [Sphingobium sp.]